MVITYRMRPSKLLHENSGLQTLLKNSFCNWVFYDLLYSICIKMIRIRTCNLWMRNVSIIRHTIVFGIISPPPSSRKIYSGKIESSPLPFHFLYSVFVKLHEQLTRCEIMIPFSKTIRFSKNFPDRPLIIPQDCLVSNDSVHFDPDCILTTVAQPHPHLSKVFGHPLNDKGLKTNKRVASQHFSYIELFFFFLPAQKAAFLSLAQYRDITSTNSQSVSYAQVTSSANVCEKSSETELVNAQSTMLQKRFNFIKQTEDLIKPYRVSIFEKYDIEVVKKFHIGYHAACFSCPILQFSLKIMQNSSGELKSSVILLKQVVTINLFSKLTLKFFDFCRIFKR